MSPASCSRSRSASERNRNRRSSSSSASCIEIDAGHPCRSVPRRAVRRRVRRPHAASSARADATSSRSASVGSAVAAPSRFQRRNTTVRPASPQISRDRGQHPDQRVEASRAGNEQHLRAVPRFDERRRCRRRTDRCRRRARRSRCGSPATRCSATRTRSRRRRSGTPPDWRSRRPGRLGCRAGRAERTDGEKAGDHERQQHPARPPLEALVPRLPSASGRSA